MSFVLSLLGALSDLVQWCIGYGQRKIGREQQQNDDAQETIQKLKDEATAAAQRPSAIDELRDGKF